MCCFTSSNAATNVDICSMLCFFCYFIIIYLFIHKILDYGCESSCPTSVACTCPPSVLYPHQSLFSTSNCTCLNSLLNSECGKLPHLFLSSLPLPSPSSLLFFSTVLFPSCPLLLAYVFTGKTPPPLCGNNFLDPGEVI
jgi:hypothetical protein